MDIPPYSDTEHRGGLSLAVQGKSKGTLNFQQRSAIGGIKEESQKVTHTLQCTLSYEQVLLNLMGLTRLNRDRAARSREGVS